MIAKKITFSGRVQGVGFRFTAHNTASRYGLSGYVRNLHNGSVEMLIQGSPDDIDSCLEDLKDEFKGYITQTEIEEIIPDTNLTSFKITF